MAARSNEERAAERYLALIRQLMAEYAQETGRTWGDRAAVAKRLDVTAGFVSMVVNEQRGPAREAIRKAIDRLSLNPDFFYGVYAGEPDYKRFIRGTPEEERPEPYPALGLFLASAEGQSTTEEERTWLRSRRFKYTPTVLTYHFELASFRSQERGADDEGEAITEAATRRAIARGGRLLKKKRGGGA